jgi:hypothetical protein
MDGWVVSDRVEESCHVGSLLEGDRGPRAQLAFEAFKLSLCDMLKRC